MLLAKKQLEHFFTPKKTKQLKDFFFTHKLKDNQVGKKKTSGWIINYYNYHGIILYVLDFVFNHPNW